MHTGGNDVIAAGGRVFNAYGHRKEGGSAGSYIEARDAFSGVLLWRKAVNLGKTGGNKSYPQWITLWILTISGNWEIKG